MANTGNSDKLKPAQRRAIAALLSERDTKAAAAAAGVGYRTLGRWLDSDIDFVLALREAESGAIDHVVRSLVRLADNAALTLEETFSGDATAGIKLRAADIVLSNLLKLRELATLEARILALEAAMKEAGNDPKDGR